MNFRSLSAFLPTLILLTLTSVAKAEITAYNDGWECHAGPYVLLFAASPDYPANYRLGSKDPSLLTYKSELQSSLKLIGASIAVNVTDRTKVWVSQTDLATLPSPTLEQIKTWLDGSGIYSLSRGRQLGSQVEFSLNRGSQTGVLRLGAVNQAEFERVEGLFTLRDVGTGSTLVRSPVVCHR